LIITLVLLNEKTRVVANKHFCIIHVISLNPVFCSNDSHAPVIGSGDIFAAWMHKS